MQKVFNVAVDIGRKLPAPAFEVNTNDLKSVKLLITITNGQTLLNLTDTTVRIAIRKPDSHIIFQDCTVKDAANGQVEIILENQAYIIPGTHTAEIMCYKGSEVVAVSGTFSYKSTKGIMNDGAVESKSEFTTISTMLKNVQETIDDIRENGTGIDAQARADILKNTAQLADTKNEINADFKMNLREMLKYPTGFSFPLSLQIIKNALGRFEIRGFDVESFHPLGKSDGKVYYISKTGNDSNNGLTPQTAFLSLSKAFTMTDVDTIYIMAGDYGRQHCYTQNLPDRDIKIKALNGKVKLGCFDNPGIIWVEHAPGVYKYTRSAVPGVYDTKILNDSGNYSMYIKKTSIAEVVSTPGTWFLDTDNMLYVHTLDNRKPANDYDVKVAMTGNTIHSTRNRTYYIEGIEFEFGNDALKLQNSKLNLLKNCKFNYAQQTNGLSILDSDMTITQNCDAYENYLDGFNYHADTWSNKYLHFVEIDNTGFRNGLSGATAETNNGSTSHANCIGIRINGLYFNNFGPNVPDVGTRNYSWNIGCTAYGSLAKSVNIDFLTENEMWLESCIAYGSPTSLYTVKDYGKFYIRNTKWLRTTFIKTPGNLIQYVQ